MRSELPVLCMTLLACWTGGARAWDVPASRLRLKLGLGRAPTHVSAGYLAVVPDGGALPQPGPEADVRDADGNRLRHGILWHDPRQGLGLVFETPAAGDHVWLYLLGSAARTVWRPGSGLTPSVVSFLKHGTEGLGEAEHMAANLPAGRNVYFERSTVMGIGAAPAGLDGPFADYTLGYVSTRDTGRAWMACMSEGPAAMNVNGRRLRAIQREDKPGGIGDWVEIGSEPLRVEIFHSSFVAADGTRKRGHAWAWWKLPGTPDAELRPGAEEQGGVPQWAARPIEPHECVQSGTTRILAADTPDASPAALFTTDALSYFWTGENPVILYRFTAVSDGNPPDTEYDWEMGGPARLSGRARAAWLFHPGRNAAVTLRASLGRRTAESTRPFTTFCSPLASASLNRPSDRQAYRDAFHGMLTAFPDDRDPTADWTQDMWDLLLELTEYGAGRALLAHLCTARRAVLVRKLQPARRWRLEDLFFPVICTVSPEKADAWIDLVERDEPDAVRRDAWKLRRAELAMYYLDDLDRARVLAGELAASRSPLARRARIRQADILFLEGQLEETLRLYAEIQSQPLSGERVETSAPSAVGRGLARSREELAAQREALRRLRRDDAQRGGDPPAPDDWRRDTARETALSETARTLIAQRHFEDAWKTLQEWELAFPARKLSGDYMIVESRFHLETGDTRRALRLLQAYVDGVEIAAHTPEAMRELLRTLVRMKAPDEQVHRFCLEIKKRFPHHPVAQEAETMADITRGTDDGEREATPDKL